MTAKIIPFPSRQEFDYGYDVAILCDRLEGRISYLMERNDWSDDSAEIIDLQAELDRLREKDQSAEWHAGFWHYFHGRRRDDPERGPRRRP